MKAPIKVEMINITNPQKYQSQLSLESCNEVVNRRLSLDRPAMQLPELEGFTPTSGMGQSGHFEFKSLQNLHSNHSLGLTQTEPSILSSL